MNWFRIIVAGNWQSGEKDVIRRFVYDERLNVFGEDLSEELSFSDIKDDHFSTFIEIDGEKYGMEIEYIPAYEINDKRSKMADFIVLIFSVVKPESYGEISKELILNIEKYKTLSQIPSNILVGNHIKLRNHPEILNNLEEQGKQPITYEIGQQLVREIKAVKYLECSSFNGTGIENVFENAVWASIRDVEKKRPKDKVLKSSWKEKLFKRLFGRDNSQRNEKIQTSDTEIAYASSGSRYPEASAQYSQFPLPRPKEKPRPEFFKHWFRDQLTYFDFDFETEAE